MERHQSGKEVAQACGHDAGAPENQRHANEERKTARRRHFGKAAHGLGPARHRDPVRDDQELPACRAGLVEVGHQGHGHWQQAGVGQPNAKRDDGHGCTHGVELYQCHLARQGPARDRGDQTVQQRKVALADEGSKAEKARREHNERHSGAAADTAPKELIAEEAGSHREADRRARGRLGKPTIPGAGECVPSRADLGVVNRLTLGE